MILPFFEQKNSIYSSVDKQLDRMFKQVVQSGGGNPFPKPTYRDQTEDPIELYLKKKMNLTDVEIFNPGEEISHPDGFQLRIQKSNIDHPESGYGVYVKGVAIPGTVIGIYPGHVYAPQELRLEVIKDNEYMVTRYDTTVVDGRKWAFEAHSKLKNAAYLLHATGVKTNESELKKYKNTFGIGQFINHPPKGGLPNLMPFSYDFPDNIDPEYVPYIPHIRQNKYHFAYQRPGCIARSIVFITSRRIENEEIFFNYRYNPANEYPDWYEQPDLQEAKRRWAAFSWKSFR